MAAAAAAADTSVQQVSLVACKYCKRTFTSDALGRHESVCMRGALNNRQRFDSHRQRIEGSQSCSSAVGKVQEAPECRQGLNNSEISKHVHV